TPLASPGDQPPVAGDRRDPTPEHIGLILSTSGTTAKPKAVPLTNANLVISAQRLARWLALTEGDCCLNVMPLFHIHGLICGVLTPLLSGGTSHVIEAVTPDAIIERARQGLDTWLTAVPTLHQAVYGALSRNDRRPQGHRLRFLRSSSAAMTPRLLADLERCWQIPVIEAYGMTEATHQMASNPLPPGERRPGSVGVAASTEIAIMDGDGQLLCANAVGEVVIKGPTVTTGYLDNPEANAQAFHNGWFRTGDQGYLDERGYLTLTGRLKELINRGGEKIAPLEVDRVLAQIPGVVESISFAAPHPTLGEEVAAAIVAAPGVDLPEAQLAAFVGQRLAPHKVPSRWVFVDALHKGPAGKLQRNGLAERLGVGGTAADAQHPPREIDAPQDPLYAAVQAVWATILQRPAQQLPGDRDVVALGGDSLMAATLANDLSHIFRVPLPLTTLLGQSMTIEGTAAFIRQHHASQSTAAPGPTPVPEEDEGASPRRCQASFSQRLFWINSALSRSAIDNVVCALELLGPLDKARLQGVLEALFERHHSLRTCFYQRDQTLWQDVLPHFKPVWTTIEVADRPGADADLERRRQNPMALDDGRPALDILLYEWSPTGHWLVIVMHHALADGLGRDQILQDLITGYRRGPQALGASTAAQPGEFARWEQACLTSGQWQPGLAQLKAQLQKALAIREKSDIDDASLQDSRARSCDIALDPLHHRQLERQAKRQGVTLGALLLAAVSRPLAELLDIDEFVVALQVANRPGQRWTNAVGCFTQQLPLPVEMTPDQGDESLERRLYRQLLATVDLQSIPLSLAFNELGIATYQNLASLMPFQFQMRQWNATASEVDGLSLIPNWLPDLYCHGILAVNAMSSAQGLNLRLTYRTALIDEEWIQEMVTGIRADLRRQSTQEI
ncbi:MAG: AMP-binding protein, partial [Candidatus Competibacterales bacterium]